jgi:hypothetical protein
VRWSVRKDRQTERRRRETERERNSAKQKRRDRERMKNIGELCEGGKERYTDRCREEEKERKRN